MTQATRLFLIGTALAAALAGCAYGPYASSGRVVVQGDHGMVDIAFSDHDRVLIRDYFHRPHAVKHKALPPGLAKRDKLPPGLQKQLVRRGQLPPGLAYQRFPDDLDRSLSRLPDGYLRVVIGGSFVLFNAHTRVIFDVIHDL